MEEGNNSMNKLMPTHFKMFSSVQSLSRVWLFVTTVTAAHQASLSITNSWRLLKHAHRVSDDIQSSYPLSSASPPAFNLSQHQGLFQWVSSSHQATFDHLPKYWIFSFNISPSNEYSGLISFRMYWLNLLAGQGTLKSLLQHHSSKASILQCWAFFIVQLSHPFMTTGKTIALTIQTFVGKVMSLLFNMLSRLVITFLPRNKHLLISWLQSPAAVILEPLPPPNKVCHCFHCFPIYLPRSDGTSAMILVFWMLSFMPTFYSPLSPSPRGSSVPLHFLP